MKDQYDASGPISRRAAPVATSGIAGGTVAIVLAVVAVLAGFLVLRSLSGGGANSADFPNAISNAEAQARTSVDPSATTAPSSVMTTPPTTAPQVVTAGATVIVVNANSQAGTAGKMSSGLASLGFTMAKPTDAAASLGRQPVTKVIYDPSNAVAQSVAESVARSLGGVKVEQLVGTPPTKDGKMGGAHVLVLLGVDLAGKRPADLTPAPLPTAPPVASTPTPSSVASSASTPTG